MTRILLVAPSIKIGGGAERVVSHFCKFLKEKHTVSLLKFYDHPEEYNIPHIRIRSCHEKQTTNHASKILKLFTRARHIRREALEMKAELIISFMEEANFPSIAAKLLMKGPKLISTVHIDPVRNYSLLYRILSRTLYPLTDSLITVSEEMVEYFRKRGITKIKSIYNSVDLAQIHKDSDETINDSREKSIFKGDQVIITVGRLVEQKNHRLLIDAFSDLAADFPKARLVIIGEGPLRNDLEEQIRKKNYQKKIFLLGNKRNVFKFLLKSRIFVLSSQFEGFGIVIVEAMACGLPIVSNDCHSGPVEILTGSLEHTKKNLVVGNGILVPFNQRKCMVRAIKEILQNRDLERKLRAASITRAKDFDNEHISIIWNRHIESVLSNG